MVEAVDHTAMDFDAGLFMKLQNRRSIAKLLAVALAIVVIVVLIASYFWSDVSLLRSEKYCAYSIVRVSNAGNSERVYRVDLQTTAKLVGAIRRLSSTVWFPETPSAAPIVVFFINSDGECIACYRLLGTQPPNNPLRASILKLLDGSSTMRLEKFEKATGGNRRIFVRRAFEED